VDHPLSASPKLRFVKKACLMLRLLVGVRLCGLLCSRSMPLKSVFVRLVSERVDVAADADTVSLNPKTGAAKRSTNSSDSALFTNPTLYVGGFHPQFGSVSFPLEGVGNYVKIIKKSALPAAVQAKLTGKKTESKVAAMESRSSITVVPEITYAVDPCIACRIDTTFRNRGKCSIYANPFVGALAYGNPTHCVEPLQGEALPGDESASSIGDSALATTPTAVSVQAAIASCAGNSERGLLYFNKTQQIGADGAASQSFRVFESVVTAALPVIAPVETALEEGAITTSIVKLVVSDAAQRRNVTIVHRGSRDTGKSRYFREACRSALDQLGSVLERAMQLYHDEKARNAEQEALAQAAAAARSGGAGGAPAPLNYEAFADGGPSEASPTGLNRSTKDQRSPSAPSSTRHRPSPRRPLTANSAESRTRFTLLSGHEGCITPRPPNLSIVSGIEASPRSGRHDAANAHGVQFGVDAGTPSAAGRPSPKNFNRRSSVKLRQALSALLKEPRLRQQLRHNGYGEEWVAATFNGRTSSLALAPIPDMERVIPSFAFDLWLRVADVAAEGQRQPPEAPTAFTGALTRAPGFSPITVKREPMTLVQICENDRPDVGMMMWVGLNFNADAHDDTLRVYVSRQRQPRYGSTCSDDGSPSHRRPLAPRALQSQIR
jgi:hypothetical protein